MEDNEYSFGATEVSSSRVSYGQGSDENGQGCDSSMVMEAGFSGKPISLRHVEVKRALLRIYIHLHTIFLAFLILNLATRWENVLQHSHKTYSDAGSVQQEFVNS